MVLPDIEPEDIAPVVFFFGVGFAAMWPPVIWPPDIDPFDI